MTVNEVLFIAIAFITQHSPVEEFLLAARVSTLAQGHLLCTIFHIDDDGIEKGGEGLGATVICQWR